MSHLQDSLPALEVAPSGVEAHAARVGARVRVAPVQQRSRIPLSFSSEVAVTPVSRAAIIAEMQVTRMTRHPWFRRSSVV